MLIVFKNYCCEICATLSREDLLVVNLDSKL